MPFRLRIQRQKSLVAQGLRYRILFSLKQDSSKQIFKAVREDKQTGVEQEVLLKVFLGKQESYKEEFESLSQVFSPYCVRLFGFEKFNNKTALVLEYIKGVSLFQLVNNFSLNPEEIQHILICLYRGLKDLNRHGLCHGDLSLDNVLVDERAYIKLIDFGKANYEQDIQGTPPFIAPEILKGAKAGFLSDLYSLGVVEAVLKTPYPLSSLKDMRPEDFDSKSPLLYSDPARRFFPFDESQTLSQKTLKLLSYKVKDLLSIEESRRCRTIKNPHSPASSFLSVLKPVFLLCVLAFLGSAPAGLSLASYGWMKVYTNKWFVLRVGGFESYTPFTVPLKAGRHFIHWRNSRSQGAKEVLISKDQALFLNDKSFLMEESP